VVCALALAVPARVRACSQSAGFVRIVSRSAEARAAVPLGAGVLIEFQCLVCGDDFQSTPPEVEVTDQNGMPVAGSARWIDTAHGGSGHALWDPDLPLAEGVYMLSWMTPFSDGSVPLVFVVGGDASETPSVSFEAALGSTRVPVEPSFQECLLGACGTYAATTQSELRPFVSVHVTHDPGLADVAQFLFRVRPEAGVAGAWYSLGDSSVELSADFAAVQKRYCVTVEAMRVSDGTVTTVGKPCVDDTLGQLRRVPEMYANCNNAPDDAQRSAAQEKYRKAWCRDNADACTNHAAAFPDACGDYAEICPHDAAHADGGVAETPADGGTSSGADATDAGDSTSANPPDAGNDPSSHKSDSDGRAESTIMPRDAAGASMKAKKSGGGCTVSRGRSDAPWIALLACVALRRARRSRTPTA
jgi:hypothetical protein